MLQKVRFTRHCLQRNIIRVAQDRCLGFSYNSSVPSWQFLHTATSPRIAINDSTFRIILPVTGSTSTSSTFPSGLRTLMFCLAGRIVAGEKCNFHEAAVFFELEATGTASGVEVPNFNFFSAISLRFFPYLFPRNRSLVLFGLRTRGDGEGVGVANINSPNDWLIEDVLGVVNATRNKLVNSLFRVAYPRCHCWKAVYKVCHDWPLTNYEYSQSNFNWQKQ